MPHRKHWLKALACLAAAFVLAVGLAACSDDDDDQIQALSYNMYFGFDFNNALVSPDLAFAQYLRTDVEGRINGMAQYLATNKPDFVGLQEVVTLTLTQGTPDPGDDTRLADFQAALAAATQAAGGPEYRVFTLTNLEFPGVINLGGTQQPFQFQVANVILVHPDWSAQAVGNGLIFQTLASVGPLTIRRGAHHVRATRSGTTIELFNTHLESVSDLVAAGQAAELVQYVNTQVGSAQNTALIFGDMNATPADPAYQVLAGAGWTDAFAAAGSGSGFTCCQAGDLDNASSQASQRIDYVFVRPGTAPSAPRIVSARVVLDQRVARSDAMGQIWPSDHFGVLATIELE
jgi:endonuclease/exonuclease/phosphatase family metal-dependent hydrolase